MSRVGRGLSGGGRACATEARRKRTTEKKCLLSHNRSALLHDPQWQQRIMPLPKRGLAQTWNSQETYMRLRGFWETTEHSGAGYALKSIVAALGRLRRSVCPLSDKRCLSAHVPVSYSIASPVCNKNAASCSSAFAARPTTRHRRERSQSVQRSM